MPRKPFGLSVKVLIQDMEGRCLLLKRSLNSKGNPGKWDLPGGKVDVGENLEQGLLREVAEEAGLTISLQRVLGAAEPALPAKRVACLILGGAAVTFGVCSLPQAIKVQPIHRGQQRKILMAQSWRTVRVFISSTFRDMHTDRMKSSQHKRVENSLTY